MKENKTIIYIAGYGRSGSTLLERILSSNEEMFGTGELSNLPDLLNDESWVCSCGEKIRECSFWGKVLEELPGNKIDAWKQTQKRNENFKYFYNHFFNGKDSKYATFNKQLFGAIFKHTPGKTNYIIDSSKTARKSFFRPLALSQALDTDIKVIHLVRDGRGCMFSNLKGSNRKMERGEDPHLPFAALRTALSWPLANTAPHLFARQEGKENYLRVRYEDFVDSPEQALTQIGNFIEVSLEPQIEMLKKEKPIPTTHQLAGNRMRKKKSITLKKDTEWKNSLKFWQKLLFWVLDWPWALKYKYL